MDTIHAMRFLIESTPAEIGNSIAKRIKKKRKQCRITQQKLSELSGVSYGSIKRFESSGEISLMALTKIAIALNCDEELKNLFAEAVFGSIQEIIDAQD